MSRGRAADRRWSRLRAPGHSVLYKGERIPVHPITALRRRRLTRFIVIWKSGCHVVSYHVYTVNVIYFLRMGHSLDWLKFGIGCWCVCECVRWGIVNTAMWKNRDKDQRDSDPLAAQTGSDCCAVSGNSPIQPSLLIWMKMDANAACFITHNTSLR